MVTQAVLNFGFLVSTLGLVPGIGFDFIQFVWSLLSLVLLILSELKSIDFSVS